MDYWQQSGGSRTLHFSKYLHMYLFAPCFFPKGSSTHFPLTGTGTWYLSLHLDTPANTVSSQTNYKGQERFCLLLGLLYLIAKLRFLNRGLYLLPAFHSWFLAPKCFVTSSVWISFKKKYQTMQRKIIFLKKIKLKQYAVTLLALGCLLCIPTLQNEWTLSIAKFMKYLL